MRKDYIFKKNPSQEDLEKFWKLDEETRKNFIKRDHNIGDKVKISDNPCSMYCGCFWKGDDELDIDKVYTIESFEYFGGGCPPKFLVFKEIKSKNQWNKGFPANWFETIK